MSKSIISSLPKPSQRKTGVVKWFNDSKGYGFIEGEDRDIFVSWTAIRGEGFKTLAEGQTVEFDLIHDSKGLLALDVLVTR